jgi:hypothetical protein
MTQTCTHIPINELLSDGYLFPSIQILLISFAILCWLIGLFQSGNFARVTRSDTSMAVFYGTYAALSGVFIAICLQVEIAKNHRVIWVLTDTVLIAYVCIFNPWFRNKLLGWIEHLKQIETR